VICISGELTEEDDIVEWLVQNRSSGDEEDTIEEVSLFCIPYVKRRPNS
jgi:hypothetical protein